ncbi:glycosyltransferase family 4 protein [uncultured Sphingomonas sp.]|uniref:glycosyltransferase family 4 protein n=1 Tax=uncultured Sphingomonas sp. TaxID=158754 RepID=UPI0025D49D60|nr:glycosyltransferase family 4 protein [uncultured Sphingomonas sp.]
MERLLIPTFEFPPYAGGVGTFCVELAKSLAARGFAVTILAPDYGKAHHPDDATYPFQVERFPASGYSAKVLPTLVRALLSRRTRFDRWLIADWPFIIAAGIARMVARLPPFRIFLHGTDALILAQGKVPKLLRTTNVFGHAEAVIANSEYTLSIARANHPSLARTPTKVALLGVNPYWFEDAGDTAEVKARLGIPAGRPLLLSVSRVDERKGHRLMIAAVAALPDDLRREAVYVIAGRPGDAGYQARLEAMVADTDATILFTGGLAQDDIRALYASADLFLLVGENRTDKIEGFGLVYLEAAGQSVPSIASPVGGVPEVVLDEATGLLVDDRDPTQTTAAIVRLLRDDATRRQFGSAARDRARTLTWQRCADVTMDIDPATPMPSA